MPTDFKPSVYDSVYIPCTFWISITLLESIMGSISVFSLVYLQTDFCMKNTFKSPGFRDRALGTTTLQVQEAAIQAISPPHFALYQVGAFGCGQESRIFRGIFSGAHSHGGCHLVALYSAWTWLPGSRLAVRVWGSAMTRTSWWLSRHMESICGWLGCIKSSGLHSLLGVLSSTFPRDNTDCQQPQNLSAMQEVGKSYEELCLRSEHVGIPVTKMIYSKILLG